MDYKAARRIMVDSQVRPNDVTDPDIVSALLNVPREAYVPSSRKSLAYSELEIETSEERALWIPRDFAKMVKVLDPSQNDIALIVGIGAGYEAAVLGELVETVIGIDEDEALVNATTERLADQGVDRAVAVQAPLGEGLPDQGPFDVILVNGMVETVPQVWLDQLADGGRLGVVVQTARGLGRARIYTRAGETVSFRVAFEARPPKFGMFNAVERFAF